ncbi:MAG: DsbA family oxidoreductase [Rhodanobacteraceae bacterium]
MTDLSHLRIDFVSDVVCPWCAIGLASLQQALAGADGVEAELSVQPFELNPGLPRDSEAVQIEPDPELIRRRAAAVGIAYNARPGSRLRNTFDAHRLLHWAALTHGRDDAVALKQALFRAYFTDGANVADADVLVGIASAADLDAAAARRVLESGAYAEATRARELHYRRAGIDSVPATIVNDAYLIAGGQPPDVFQRALRDIAARAPSRD